MELIECLKILAPLHEIGGATEGNYPYQKLLAAELKAIGKPTEDLRIAEVIQVVEKATARFEALCNEGLL